MSTVKHAHAILFRVQGPSFLQILEDDSGLINLKKDCVVQNVGHRFPDDESLQQILDNAEPYKSI